MSLDELREKLAKKTDVFQSTQEFPARWKSLTNGMTQVIRRDGDRLYVETLLSAAQMQAGAFVLAEFKKQGDIYAGKQRVSFACSFMTTWAAFKENRGVHEVPMAITLLTPTRIEGWAMLPPAGAQFDCKKGRYSKPFSERRSFVWIPEASQ